MTIGLGSGRAVWAVVERLPRGTRAVVASELTRERARQIEAKLTARLRDFLRAEIPDFELLEPPKD